MNRASMLAGRAERNAYNAAHAIVPNPSPLLGKDDADRLYGICKVVVHTTLKRGCIHRFGRTFLAYRGEGGQVFVTRLGKMKSSPNQRMSLKQRHKMTDPTPQDRGEVWDMIGEVYVRVAERILARKVSTLSDTELYGAARTAMVRVLEGRANEVPVTGDTIKATQQATLIQGELRAGLLDKISPQLWGIVNQINKGIPQSIIAQNEGVTQQAISKAVVRAEKQAA
jgi:hypothetical protein